MTDVLSWWQSLPLALDPIAFQLGPVAIRWYGLAYVAGVVAVYGVALYARRWRKSGERFARGLLFDALLFAFLGALVGGRLGYVLGYAPEYFLKHPLTVVSPFSTQGQFVGIGGMSFFGGALGVYGMLVVFARLRRVRVLALLDALILGLPVALFFGRLTNFANGELIGRVTTVPWGVQDSANPTMLRHPSALYEAVLEGGLTFVLLYALSRWRVLPEGGLGAVFLLLYGGVRFGAEFFREPDRGAILRGDLSPNQWLALFCAGIGAMTLVWLWRRNSAIVGQSITVGHGS